MLKGRGGDEHLFILCNCIIHFFLNPAFHNSGEWGAKDSTQSNSFYFLYVWTQCLKYTKMVLKSLEEGYVQPWMLFLSTVAVLFSANIHYSHSPCILRNCSKLSTDFRCSHFIDWFYFSTNAWFLQLHRKAELVFSSLTLYLSSPMWWGQGGTPLVISNACFKVKLMLVPCSRIFSRDVIKMPFKISTNVPITWKPSRKKTAVVERTNFLALSHRQDECKKNSLFSF